MIDDPHMLCEIIRIHRECEGGIEKSVPGITRLEKSVPSADTDEMLHSSLISNQYNTVKHLIFAASKFGNFIYWRSLILVVI